jgi:hypothetical protein
MRFTGGRIKGKRKRAKGGEAEGIGIYCGTWRD